MPRLATPETDVETLIQWYQSDIIYDAHSLRAKIHRSDARKELIRRGKTILTEIGKHLTDQFPDPMFPQEHNGQQELFEAWLSVMYGIAKEDRELEQVLPYARDVQFGVQSMTEWIRFCLRQEHVAVG